MKSAVAIIFSLANAAMLFWRIREEDSALALRQAIRADGDDGGEAPWQRPLM